MLLYYKINVDFKKKGCGYLLIMGI